VEQAYGVRISSQGAAGICALIAAKLEDPKAVCAGLSPRYLPPEAMKACENDLSSYASDDAPARARDGIPSHLNRRYVGFERFKRARRAGDAKLCGHSEFCRALMGEGPALAEEAAARTAAKACVEVRAAAGSAVAQVEAWLAQAGSSASPGHGARALRLARLQDSLRALRRR
jgi:hypothetical protein